MKKKITPKILVVCVATVALSGLAITTFAADKLVVKDPLGTTDVFKVGDDGSMYTKNQIKVGIQESLAQFHTAVTGVPATFVVERLDGVFAEFLNGTTASLFSFENGGAFWIAEGSADRVPGSGWSPTAGTAHLVVESGGNIGVGTKTPNSKFQVVDGYVQLDTTTGAPPAEDCLYTADYGRMKVDPTGTGTLWICSEAGWTGI